MLTVSLHGIKIEAPYGLYPEERITGNTFETDVDIWLPDQKPWPFADYAIINRVVHEVFAVSGELLEEFVAKIHSRVREEFPYAEKVRVAIRKLHPPMPGTAAYSQVCYEK
jgi:7,8-dihydroneopterin aldolase/epimerase/oxygenase